MTRLPIVSFTVPGEPASKERPRFGKGRTFTPKRTLDAETRVIDAFDLAYPLEEAVNWPVAVELTFYRSNRRRVDVDNLAKTVLDALNGVAYVDDYLIVDLHARKRLDRGNPRTEVTIWIHEEKEEAA